MDYKTVEWFKDYYKHYSISTLKSILVQAENEIIRETKKKEAINQLIFEKDT